MSTRALLILQEGPGHASQRWALESRATLIGRWASCDIVLSDREVSRRHAVIRHDVDRWVIQDLDSCNGVMVNGNAIARATRLRDGDTLEIPPRYRFVFFDGDATSGTEARKLRLRIDSEGKRVVFNGQVVEPALSIQQFMLIELLASEPGRVFTREEVSARCYPDVNAGVSNLAIEGLVRRLRARFAKVAPGTPVIAVSPGHGVRLVL